MAAYGIRSFCFNAKGRPCNTCVLDHRSTDTAPLYEEMVKSDWAVGNRPQRRELTRLKFSPNPLVGDLSIKQHTHNIHLHPNMLCLGAYIYTYV